jgi:hypothetical protein
LRWETSACSKIGTKNPNSPSGNTLTAG